MKLNFGENKLGGQQLLAILLVAAWILVGYVYLFLRPKFNQLGELGPQVARLKNDIRETKIEAEKLPQWEQKAAALRKDMSEYQELLPPEEEIPAMLENLSRLATSCRVKILEVTPVGSLAVPEGSGSEELFREIPFLIKAHSGYHELGSFIQHLEGGDRLVKISDLKIESGKSDSRLSEVELKISFFALTKGKTSLEHES